MTDDNYSFIDLAKDIAKALTHFASIAGVPSVDKRPFNTWLLEMGWDIDLDQDITGGDVSLINIGNQLRTLIDNNDFDIPKLIEVINTLTQAEDSLVDDLGFNLDPPMFADLRSKLPRQILDYALIEYLEERHPLIYGILSVLGIAVIKYEERPESYRIPYLSREMRWEVLRKILSEPNRFFEIAHGWGTTEFDGENLFNGLDLLLSELNVEVARCTVSTDPVATNENMISPIRLSFLERDNISFGIEFYISEFSGYERKGIAVSPYVEGELDFNVPLGEIANLDVKASTLLNRSIILSLHPDTIIQLISNYITESLDSSAQAKIDITPNRPLFILGNPEKTFFELKSLKALLFVNLVRNNPETGIELTLEGLRIHMSSEGSDGFLEKLLSGAELDASIKITIGWASLNGMYIKTSGAFEVVIPLHKQIGPLFFESIILSMTLDGSKLKLASGLNFNAEIGPVSVSVNRIGAYTDFQVSDCFRVNDVSYGFLPPLGAGLKIDTGTIKGGGYLEYDKPNERYAGILELNFGKIGMTATGLITTKMPDGSKGYSLLVNIGITFDPPITLPYNFCISGVGGLIGINRVMLTDELREGLRNQTLDSILFPENAIENAAKIISDMRTVFPPEDGRYVVGPQVKIGWSKNIITADIGIFIEMPSPVRTALLGQIAAAFPNPDNAVVEIHIDVLGILELDKKQLSIDATVFNSRIYTYQLFGDCALRWAWGSNPVFAMSLGGFHPRFSPPSGFPALRRLTLDLSQDSTLKLYCQAYHALTSNSLQFGARADLYAKKGGASIEGNIYFDTLINFSPFSFIVSTGGSMLAKYKGYKLAGIHLSMELSGPRPWNARGTAKFEILCWEPEVKFNKTWGPDTAITIDPVDPWIPLKADLENRGSWGSRLPAGNTTVESMVSLDGESETYVVVHPSGFLEVRQSVLPLGITIDKLGNAPVNNHNLFNITSMTINGESVNTEDIEEYFARGQFIDLSENDRLCKPSFEMMKAGVSVGSEKLAFDESNIKNNEFSYESILIQEDRTSKPAGANPKIDWLLGRKYMQNNAAKRCGLYSSGENKFMTRINKNKTCVKKDSYVITNSDDMSILNQETNGTMGFTQAEQALSQHLNEHPEQAPNFEITPLSEAAV